MFSKEAVEYRLKGYHARQNKDYDEAIKYLQKASMLDPCYASPHNDLGIIYEIKGWYEKAEQAYLRALSIDPHNAEAIMNLGLLYESRGLVDKASPYFQRRIELGPPGDPWVNRARELLSKYAPALYKEITEKEEARNLMYEALEEKSRKTTPAKPERPVEEERIIASTAQEPEYMVSERLENYLRLERDLVEPELKNWLLGLNTRMVAMLYGQPSYKRVITADGKEIEQPEWYNRWIANLEVGPQISRDVFIQDDRRLREKWIYIVPYRYKKYALKPRIILIFENNRLSAWEK